MWLCGYTLPPFLLKLQLLPQTNELSAHSEMGNMTRHHANGLAAAPTLHVWKSKKHEFTINFTFTEAAKSHLAFPSSPRGEEWTWFKIEPGLLKRFLKRIQHFLPNLPIPYPCSHLYSTKCSSDGGGGHSPCSFSHNLNSSVHSPSLVHRMRRWNIEGKEHIIIIGLTLFWGVKSGLIKC